MGGKMGMFKSSVGIAILAGVLASCGQESGRPAEEAPPQITAAAEAPAETPVLLGVFEGVLPCADCPGIETRLELTRKGPHWGDGTYRLTETYQGRGDPIVSEGEWGTLRGSAVDPDATVYQLDPATPETSRYFRADGEDALRMLDRDLNETPADMPYTLTRVAAE